MNISFNGFDMIRLYLAKWRKLAVPKKAVVNRLLEQITAEPVGLTMWYPPDHDADGYPDTVNGEQVSLVAVRGGTKADHDRIAAFDDVYQLPIGAMSRSLTATERLDTNAALALFGQIDLTLETDSIENLIRHLKTLVTGTPDLGPNYEGRLKEFE